ncbi:hypothetical protein GGI35DRAFT_398216 [Trichoderma velutinum]
MLRVSKCVVEAVCGRGACVLCPAASSFAFLLLLDLQTKQFRRWAAGGAGVVAITLVEGVTAFVQCLDGILAASLVVIVLGETICDHFSSQVVLGRVYPNCVVCFAYPGWHTENASKSHLVSTRMCTVTPIAKTYCSWMTRRACFHVVFGRWLQYQSVGLSKRTITG